MGIWPSRTLSGTETNFIILTSSVEFNGNTTINMNSRLR